MQGCAELVLVTRARSCGFLFGGGRSAGGGLFSVPTPPKSAGSSKWILPTDVYDGGGRTKGDEKEADAAAALANTKDISWGLKLSLSGTWEARCSPLISPKKHKLDFSK